MKFFASFLLCAMAVVATNGKSAGPSLQADIDTSVCDSVPEGETEWHPVPGDCTRYIICDGNDGAVEQCDKGTWWHQQILDCDYPGSYCLPGSTRQPAA